MKKVISLLIILLLMISSLAADGNVLASTKNQVINATPSVNVSFFYDADAMQRLSFGFTDSTSITWDSSENDLSSSGIFLDTQFANDLSGEARGYGAVNFYWILRTNKPVSAKLYLVSPMTEITSGASLDWSIVFDSKKDNTISHNNSIDSVYGENNAVEIFSKSAAYEISMDMNYLPIQVYTAYTEAPDNSKHYYKGNVGVLVETNL